MTIFEVRYGTTLEKVYQSATHIGLVLVALQENVEAGLLMFRKVYHGLPENLLCSSLSLRLGSREYLVPGLIVGIVVLPVAVVLVFSGRDGIVGVKHEIFLSEQGFLLSSLFILNFLSSVGCKLACDSL